MQFGMDVSNIKSECGHPDCVCAPASEENEMPIINRRDEYAREIERFKPMTEWLATRVVESGVYEPGTVVEVVEASASIEDDHASLISIRYLLDGKLSPNHAPYTWFLDGNEARQAIRVLLDIQLQATFDATEPS